MGFTKRKTTSITIPNELHKEFSKYCIDKETSVSNAVKKLMERELEKEEEL